MDPILNTDPTDEGRFLTPEEILKSAIDDAREVVFPQPGKQSQFLNSTAMDVLYGGAYGGGKSFGLILCALRGLLSIPGYQAVIYRRTLGDFKSGGGIIVELNKLFPKFGAKYNKTDRIWTFPKWLDIKT